MPKRPLLLSLVLVLLVSLFAFAATAGAAPRTSVVVRALASGGWQAMPVRGAAVRVFDGNGRLVGRGRVGSQGMAIVRARARRGADLRVVVAGGRIGRHRFGGALVSDFRRYRFPLTVHVDPVTTLEARLAGAHRNWSNRRVQRRTKRFLELPGGYKIGLDGRTNVAFDGRRFLAASGTGRHFDRFVAQLVRKMGKQGTHRSFAHPQGRLGHGQAGGSAIEAGGSGLGGLAEDIEEGSGAFKMLEEGDAVVDFANLALAIAGAEEQNAIRKELAVLGEQLQQIEQSLALVQETVEDLQREGRESTYSKAAAEVEDIQAGVVGAEDMLHSAVSLSLQEGCGGESPGPKCGQVAGMMTGPSGFMENIAAAGLKVPAQLNAYAEHIGGDAVPSAPANVQGLVQDASALTTGGSHQLFYSQADSEELREATAFWVTSYTEALGLSAAYWRIEGANESTIDNDLEQIAADARSMPQMLPEALPPGVAVDMDNGQMWSTNLSGQGTSLPFATLAAGKWEYEAGPERWASTNGQTLGGFGGGSGNLRRFANWQIAGNPQLQGLQNGVTAKPGEELGEAIRSQAGFEWGVILPGDFGYGHAPGLETEYVASGWERKGCQRGAPRETCFWPVWVEGNLIGNLDYRENPHYYDQGTFYDSDFLAIKWDGVELWGDNNAGTVYGPLATWEIPYLFYREVQSNECWYYPSPGDPASGSPGCPS
jgi:hypothetical protein